MWYIYKIDIKIENAVYENNKGDRICIKKHLFKDVRVGPWDCLK